MMSTPDILAALTPVVDAFERLGIAYHIGGSVASSAYGIARATLDVDLVADVQAAHVQPLVALLQEAYYIDREMVQEAVRHRSSFNVIHLDTMIKVDVFILKLQPYAQESFRRARRDTLVEDEPAHEFYLATPEDVILNKLDWFRLGGGVSDRQWNDVLGVLKVQALSLDLSYLRRWAAELGLTELLDRAFNEAGIT
jgi:hypothetical protein